MLCTQKCVTFEWTTLQCLTEVTLFWNFCPKLWFLLLKTALKCQKYMWLNWSQRHTFLKLFLMKSLGKKNGKKVKPAFTNLSMIQYANATDFLSSRLCNVSLFFLLFAAENRQILNTPLCDLEISVKSFVPAPSHYSLFLREALWSCRPHYCWKRCPWDKQEKHCGDHHSRKENSLYNPTFPQ